MLDLDRMLIEDKSDVGVGHSPSDHDRADGGLYQIAAYGPEFLAALKIYFATRLGAQVDIAVFSAGTEHRNRSVVESISITQDLKFADWVTEVKSFNDLTPLKSNLTDSSGSLSNETLWSQIQALGGQDKIPFFGFFTKDLAAFDYSQSRVIIFEDNFNAVPVHQRNSLVVVARPDVIEERLRFHSTTSTEHWAPQDRRSSVQVDRARYRLVRAIGILSRAVDRVQRGDSETLPDALLALQWQTQMDGSKHFQSRQVNDSKIYQEGFQILKSVYEQHLMPNEPVRPRARDYFEPPAFRPSRATCESLFLNSEWSRP